MSTEEDEEELDEERISAIKKLLYKTFKVSNRQGMRVKDLQTVLETLFKF